MGMMINSRLHERFFSMRVLYGQVALPIVCAYHVGLK